MVYKMKTEAGTILDSNDLLWQLNTTRPASPPGVVVSLVKHPQPGGRCAASPA